jgi:hypothetical protein
MSDIARAILGLPVVSETTQEEHSLDSVTSWFEEITPRAQRIWEQTQADLGESTSVRFPGMFFLFLPGEEGEIFGFPEAVIPPQGRFDIVRSLSQNMEAKFVLYISEVVAATGSDMDLAAVGGDIRKMATAARYLYISLDGAGVNRSRVYPMDKTIDVSEVIEQPVPESSPCFNLSGLLGQN